MQRVRRSVLTATKGTQVPWDRSSLTGEFYFRPAPDVSAAAGANVDRGLRVGDPSRTGGSQQYELEKTYWETIRHSAHADDFDAYLKEYPDGVFATLARNRLRRLKEKHASLPAASGSPKASTARPVIAAPNPKAVEAALRLRRDDRAMIQRGLNAMRHAAGPDDGLFGRRTREAIRRYQSAKALPQTGYLTEDQAASLIARGKRVRVEPRSKVASATSSKVTFSMLDTDLKEGGKPVRLEVVLAKPSGPGPFPLFVVNHGSTGRGADPKKARRTEWYKEISDFFTRRGWMVAFPQRRGRGKSDGLYDEGFASDRTEGYACFEVVRSLDGFDRALTDIDAAITALLRRSDVSRKHVLIGGVSRGGILSIAYAGKHTNRVVGVINFVGGWLTERCRNSQTVHPFLFEKGGTFSGPTLWIYGKDDPKYSIDHSRANFEAFRKAGGKGDFFALDVPSGHPLRGHRLHPWTSVWSGPVETYLRKIAVPSTIAAAPKQTETESGAKARIQEKRQDIVSRPAATDKHTPACDAPVPADVRILPPAASVPRAHAKFSGQWGPARWNGKVCHILFVEEVTDYGKARIVYSHGAVIGRRNVKPSYSRSTADIVDGKLIRTVEHPRRGTVVVTYWFSGDNTLWGTYRTSTGSSFIILERP